MALTRKFLASKGLEADVIEEIITAHTESISGLKDSIDEYKKYESKAKELDAVQKELDDLKAKVAENSDKDYDKLKQEFDAYKADVEEKATRNAKETAYKALLKDVGVPERHFDKILKYSKETLDKLVLDEDGNITDSKELRKSIKDEWGDHIEKKGQQGSGANEPPANNGGKALTKADIMNIKDTTERQAAWKSYLEEGGE